jgi:hypothetical protein
MSSLISSNLRSADYDPFNGTLLIQFRGGRLYRYSGVPYSTYSGLMNAPSHGRYFHRHIRNRYPYRRIR